MRFASLTLGLLAAFSLTAQTLVEHSLITAGGSTGAAAAGKGVGKSIGGIFDKLKTTLDPAKPAGTRTEGSATIHIVAPAGESPKPNTACADEPAKVAVGLAYDEVLARCGVPSLKTNTGADGLMLWFTAKEKETVVTLASGKVSAVSTTQKRKEGIVVVQ